MKASDPGQPFNQLLSGLSFGMAGADFICLLQWAGNPGVTKWNLTFFVAALPFLVLAGAIPAYRNVEGAEPRKFDVARVSFALGLVLFVNGFEGAIFRLIGPLAGVTFNFAMLLAFFGFLYGRKNF